MRIIFDAMGGDHAPAEILMGASDAVKAFGIEMIAVGDADKIAKAVSVHNIDMTNIRVVHAAEVIEMCDEPSSAIRNKKNSSMVVALRMLAADEGDAMVSAGSTGALLTGATLIVKRIRGVKRPAIGTVVPGADKPFLLLDSGANAQCRPEMLNDFATLGSIYASKAMGITNPCVGLVNIGEEETKGTPEYVQANALMRHNSAINFIGNVETKIIPTGRIDVVVCDGFTGNVILKLIEGLAASLMGEIKKVFLKNALSKLAFIMVKSGMREFKHKLSPDEAGGALLIGVSKPVVKAHGSSNARAFFNAVRQTIGFCESDIVGAMTKVIAERGINSKDEANGE